MILLARQTYTHRYKKQIYGYQGGRRGRNWEVGVDTYTLLILCIKERTIENLLYSAANYLMHCGHPNGRKSRREGMQVYVHILLYSKN